MTTANQMIFRFCAEKKVLGLGVKEGRPFRQSFAPKVYETAVKIRSGNYEEIVGIESYVSSSFAANLHEFARSFKLIRVKSREFAAKNLVDLC